MDSYANELRDLHGLEIRNDFSRHQVRVDLSVATVKHLSLFEKDLQQMYLHFNVQMKILEEFYMHVHISKPRSVYGRVLYLCNNFKSVISHRSLYWWIL